MKSKVNPTRASYYNLQLNAALVGSVDTAVARFNGAGTFEGNGLEEATTAENGTIVTVNVPGTYAIEAAVPVDGAGTGYSVHAGISRNAEGTDLTDPPVISMTSMLDADTIEAPIDTQIVASLKRTVYLEGGDEIRLHLNDAAGLALAARSRLSITRVAD